jgi:hypothetical protein
VDYNSKVQFDLKTHPLQIQTKSRLGSDDRIAVRFRGEDSVIGSLTINFGREPTYMISRCTETEKKFLSLPNSNTKLWTIRKSDNFLTVECNDELVLEYEFDSSNSDQCSTSWSRDVESIIFLSLDTASVKFRAVGTGQYIFLSSEDGNSYFDYGSHYPKFQKRLGRNIIGYHIMSIARYNVL